MKHVDDFIKFPPDDLEGRYAAFFFFLHRLPALMQVSFSTWIDPVKLFCTYKLKRYRVTGASRLGDIWLAEDFERSVGYDLRVELEDCTEWSNKPDSVLVS